MKLINKKNKNYTQVFHLFTEEEWIKTNKNFNKNISTFFTGKKHEIFVNAHELRNSTSCGKIFANS
jgi:leucyl aminopeptidase